MINVSTDIEALDAKELQIIYKNFKMRQAYLKKIDCMQVENARR